MPDYRRAWHPGGTYFFTVNLLQRRNNDLLVRQIGLLREVVKSVRQRHPFFIHGWVVLPNHLHCVIELPADDADFATRWRLIKAGFSKALPRNEHLSAVRVRRGERGIWQRRFWEHLIRDERDYRAHMDYVHINPMKHGLVKRVVDWHQPSIGWLSKASTRWIGREEMKGIWVMTISRHSVQCASLIAPYVTQQSGRKTA